MIVGENSRSGDMDVNPTKEKKLTNIRTHCHDESLRLTPPRPLTLGVGARVHRRRRAGRGHARSRSGCASGPCRSTTGGARSAGPRTCAGRPSARAPTRPSDVAARRHVRFGDGATCPPPYESPTAGRRRDPGHPRRGPPGRRGRRCHGQAAGPEGRRHGRLQDPADRERAPPPALRRHDGQRRAGPVRDPRPPGVHQEAVDHRPGRLSDRRHDAGGSGPPRR